MTPDQEDHLTRAAARGDEEAQLSLATAYLCKTVEAENTAQWLHWVEIGGAFAMLAASHGRVDSVRVYAQALRARVNGGDLKPSSAAEITALVSDLDAAVEGRSPDERVEVRI
jgi:hypothetical protein